jgi:hypothetical protein
MYGLGMGSLAVIVGSDKVWSKTGDQGNAWRNATVGLASYAGQIHHIQFVGTRGSSYYGDAAIDDVVLYQALALNSSSSNDSNASGNPINPTSKELFDHNITSSDIFDDNASDNSTSSELFDDIAADTTSSELFDDNTSDNASGNTTSSEFFDNNTSDNASGNITSSDAFDDYASDNASDNASGNTTGKFFDDQIQVDAIAAAAGTNDTNATNVRVTCHDGSVPVSQTCVSRCTGGMEVSLSGTNLTATMLEGGLDHGIEVVTVSCDSYFNESEGQIGFFCFDGALKSIGVCTPAATTPVCAPCGEAVATKPCLANPTDPRPSWMFGLCEVGAKSPRCNLSNASNEVLLAMGAGVAVVPSLLVGLVCGLCLAHCCSERPLRRRRCDMSTQTSRCGQPAWTQTKPPVQLSLDLVCCVDAGPDVTQLNFRKALDFIAGLSQDLEMPPTRVGVLVFNRGCTVLARLDCGRAGLLFALRGAIYSPGDDRTHVPKLETTEPAFGEDPKLQPRLAPTFVKAAEMLSQPLEGHASTERKKVVLLITESEPDDLLEVEHIAALLRQNLTQVVCVGIGEKKHCCTKLASMPSSRCVFGVRSYNELGQIEASVINALAQTTRLKIIANGAGSPAPRRQRTLGCCASPRQPEGVPPVLNFDRRTNGHGKAPFGSDDKELPTMTVLDEPKDTFARCWSSLE